MRSAAEARPDLEVKPLRPSSDLRYAKATFSRKREKEEARLRQPIPDQKLDGAVEADMGSGFCLASRVALGERRAEAHEAQVEPALRVERGLRILRQVARIDGRLGDAVEDLIADALAGFGHADD